MMPAQVLSFGTIALVRDIPIGEVFVLPTYERTVIAMMVGRPQEHEPKYLVWLNESPRSDEERFDLVAMEHYSTNKAVIVDNATFVLSPAPRHMMDWGTQSNAGIIVRSNESNLIACGRPGRMRSFVDLASGMFAQRPTEDKLVVAYSSWSIARRYADEGGRMVSIPLCEWEVSAL
jgi:hypothetical protein